MKKKLSAIRRQKKQNVPVDILSHGLPSQQWISESSQQESESSSGSPSGSPTPAPSLHILYKGSDVTGGTIDDVFSGDPVGLTAVVKPKNKFTGTNWKWSAPDILVKAFEGAPSSGKKENYKPIDFKAEGITLHWVDDGAKEVKVTAKVKGKKLSATTTVNVTRPTVDLNMGSGGPNFQSLGLDIYKVWCLVRFSADNLSEPGDLGWIQLGQYKLVQNFFVTPTITKGPFDGLDSCNYFTSTVNPTEDRPSILFDSFNMLNVIHTQYAKMWLMWRHKKKGVFVPLKSVTWHYNGVLVNHGLHAPPQWADPPGNLDFVVDNPQNELNYPSWTSCWEP